MALAREPDRHASWMSSHPHQSTGGGTVDSSITHHYRHPAKPRLKAWNAFTRWILHIPLLRAAADRQVCELRFAGRRSGKTVVLPVMYAQHEDTLVILVGGPET